MLWKALSSSHGAVGAKDWQMGLEKSHLLCALCGHTPPGLANSCFHKHFFEFWEKQQ